MAEIFRLPELFTGLESAVITDWELAEGAQFAHGALLATAETDKASVELEAPHDGVLLRILTPQGGRVLVDGPVAVLGGVGEAADAVDELLAAEGLGRRWLRNRVGDPRAVPGVAAVQATADRHPDGGPLTPRSASSPARWSVGWPGSRASRSTLWPARARAAASGESISSATWRAGGTWPYRTSVTPSLPPGRAELDVAPSRTPVLDAEYLEVPAGGMRRIVAARMAQSKAEMPHFYLRGSARMDALMAMRSQINDGSDVRVSVNDLIVKAVAAAHARHPEMNVSWVDGSIRHWRHVDVGVAIATSRGLVTPVVRQVDRATVTAIAAEIRDLAARAEEGDLRLDELEGGSISVTNLGMHGTEEFSGIINPSQSAILAVGAVRDEAVVEDGMITVGKVARFTLSVDHRPLDGVMAAEWMRTFLMLVESPLKLLA